MQKPRKHTFSIIKTNRHKKAKKRKELTNDPSIGRNPEQTIHHGENGHRIMS